VRCGHHIGHPNIREDFPPREGVNAAIIDGDSFHRHDRKEMKLKAAEAEKASDNNFSHFGPSNNLFPELAELFRAPAETGKRRKYLHDTEEAGAIHTVEVTVGEELDDGASVGAQKPKKIAPTQSKPCSSEAILKIYL
jgi:phosphoribulokinase